MTKSIRSDDCTLPPRSSVERRGDVGRKTDSRGCSCQATPRSKLGRTRSNDARGNQRKESLAYAILEAAWSAGVRYYDVSPYLLTSWRVLHILVEPTKHFIDKLLIRFHGGIPVRLMRKHHETSGATIASNSFVKLRGL
jgi:hypothetical protein